MKKSLVLAMAMALGVTASAYAANPFSDVPAGHWAYDSVAKLAAAGVVDGYGDGTYGGDKLMTRYEMAQIVARAMANGANVDKLAAEFADELDALGVRVAALEKKQDAVKITGQVRYHYSSQDVGASASQLRSRIWIKGQVNDDWSYTGMLENIQNFRNDYGDEDTKFQRAFVNGKIGGVAVEAGRNNLNLVAGGEVYGNRVDYIKASYGKEVKLSVMGGKLADGYQVGGVTTKANSLTDSDGEEFYAGVLNAKLGVVDAALTYVDVSNQTSYGKNEDNSIFGAEVALPVAKDLRFTGVYLLADNDDAEGNDDGYIVKLHYKGAKANKPGSWGLWAQYGEVAGSAYINRGFESGLYKNYRTTGYKGYQVGATYAFAKNIVGLVEYTDLEARDGNGVVDNNMLWSELVFSF